MQPIDRADPRPPNVQIAASIRAAILTGELRPGTQLPSGQELARFFGVARQTVQTAVNTLRTEGYVRGQVGSGVFVQDKVSLPSASEENGDEPLAGAAAYLFEVGSLKNLPRAGWLRLGIPLPESVAEHSFRVGVVGLVLAAIEGADVGRTSALCLLHDSPETRTGDVTAIGRAYVTTEPAENVAVHQTAGMPEEAAKVFRDLVAEYEAGQTPEAQVAKDADKLESLLQAVEYQAQGFDTTAWQDTSVTALRTDAGRQLARAIMAADPHSWWSAFAASYPELKAGAKGRARARAQLRPDVQHHPGEGT
jgi:5'-deoxynucleotidase YfbR-like HD superfamily hydrolase/DNA-binding transcriptional regulator YhcF (GntR family)